MQELTNKFDLSPVFERAVKAFQKSYDEKKGPTEHLSVTDVLKTPLIRRLEKDFGDQAVEDVTDRIWALFGQAVHEVLSKYGEAQAITEERLKTEIDGVLISGQLDHYENETITDYKITSVWKVKHGDYKDFENQLNCYAFLMESAGFPVNKIKVSMILRDWMASKALYDPTYPQCQIIEITLNKWKEAEIKSFLHERIKLHIEADWQNISDIPICSPADRWATKGSFALMKKGRKSAVKLFDKKEDAENYAIDNRLAFNHYVEERKGEDKRCSGYCRVNKFCPFYQEKYMQGQTNEY